MNKPKSKPEQPQLIDVDGIKPFDGNRAQNLTAIVDFLANSKFLPSSRNQFERELRLVLFQQLRTIAEEFAPLYAVHYVAPSDRHPICKKILRAGVTTNDPTVVTCKDCLFEIWLVRLDVQLETACGRDWKMLDYPKSELRAEFDKGVTLEELTARTLAQLKGETHERR